MTAFHHPFGWVPISRLRESDEQKAVLLPATIELATVVAARYAIALHGWNGEITDEMRSKLRGLRGVTREVARLRRGGQFLERMKIQREWLALGSKASDLNQ